MKNYLEDKPRKVSITITVDVTVGHFECDFCGADTPSPTEEVIRDRALQYATSVAGRGGDLLGPGMYMYLWPGKQNDDEEWFMPPGWGYCTEKFACPECLRAVNAALKERKKEKR